MQIKNFTNRYPVSKTLRFKLIPEGKTLEYFEKDQVLIKDKQRQEDFDYVKTLMDEYHRSFIDEVLESFHLEYINEFSNLYYKKDKTQEEKEEIKSIQEKMRKSISDAFIKNDKYKGIIGEAMIKEYLPNFLKNNTDIEKVKSFSSSTTYFKGFNENRSNMYTGDGNSTEIAYRIVDDNLPKFLNNIKRWEKATESIGEDVINVLREEYKASLGVNIDGLFNIDEYDFVLRQKDIEIYNQVVGGYSPNETSKVKGINEYINEYNQKNEKKLLLLDTLFKQVLGDKTSLSFMPNEFKKDEEVLSSILEEYEKTNDNTKMSIIEVIEKTRGIFNTIEEYNKSRIYILNKYTTELSNQILDNWSAIKEVINSEYDSLSKAKNKSDEKYLEKRNKELKSIASYSITEYDNFIKKAGIEANMTTCSYLKAKTCSICESIKLYFDEFVEAKKAFNNETKLTKNTYLVEKIKNLLDETKELQRLIDIFDADISKDKDDYFYSELDQIKETLKPVTSLYNKTRNYITKKPYSLDKLKLTFENTQLMDGWDRNKEKDYLTAILRKGNNTYIAIMKKDNKKVFENIPKLNDGEDYYEKMIYKLLPDPSRMLPKVFFSKKGLSVFNPSKAIKDIYENGTFKKGESFKIDDCRKLIDFYKESINSYGDWNEFGFNFSNTSTYMNISDFYNEVKEQGYKIRFDKISSKFINEKVDNGELYLFRIYNKDFSSYSKGTKNLHTLYFEALFSETNLKDIVYALNGGAEMFYREASLKLEDTTIHKANDKLTNKNELNPKKESVFEYDIIKDKRFTEPQFMLHLPVTMNYKAKASTNLNIDVREKLREDEDNYVIGIDRGERNLIYICVINGKGEIVEQVSLNSIINNVNNVNIETNYHDLLNEKEKYRDNERKEWKTIENIKELKEGYISQVVHKIVELVEKYDAVIGLEDLSAGFKNTRTYIEKQVYQKFEKMLIDKLNYYVNKKSSEDVEGGLYKAYQLTNKFESFSKMGKQNGILFYIPAWLTSKIDPQTGFVNLINTRYKSVDESKKLVEKFDNIRYLNDEGMFAFDINYDNFDRGSIDYTKNWTLYTNGERIVTFRNPDINNAWDSKTVNIRDEFISLFRKYDIDITRDIKQQILSINDKDFFVKLLKDIGLMLQMRNSETGTQIDYLVSPVKNRDGNFYNSNDYTEKDSLPCDADANGAYHIALKTQWAINQIKTCEENDIKKVNLAISNIEWLKYAQTK